MAENNREQYRETTDLYWELLRDARKQADQQLVHLIRERIANKTAPASAMTEKGCDIIHFPPPVEYFSEPEAEVQFWRENRFWQDLLFTTSFVSFGLCWILYFFFLVMRS